MIKLNKIYNENCIKTLNRMPNNFIDLTVTSPPYDDLREYNGYTFDFKSIARELYRVTKQGAVLVWVVGDKIKNGSETGTSFKQATYFKEIGFNINDTMIWRKTNPMPQVKQSRYASEFEYMFVFSKGKIKTFNPIMIPTKCGGQNYNSTAKLITRGKKRRQLKHKINPKKVKGEVWDIAVAQNKTKHPAVFPEKLAEDHIISWSNEGDIVYDPFMGSGTTAKMSILNNRIFIGSEISCEYCEIANERITKYLNTFNELDIAA